MEKAIANNNNSNNLAIVSPENLLTTALEKGASVESIEKILLMRKELKAEWSREQFFKSLSAFQKECPTINKNRKVSFATKKGKTQYNYADLESIVSTVKDVIEKHGFSYTIKTEQTKQEVTAICHANHIDGHTEITSFSIPIDYDAYMNNAQKVASALTYAKRYAFSNAFGIMTADDDDDGHSADNNFEPRKEPYKKPNQPQKKYNNQPSNKLSDYYKVGDKGKVYFAKGAYTDKPLEEVQTWYFEGVLKKNFSDAEIVIAAAMKQKIDKLNLDISYIKQTMKTMYGTEDFAKLGMQQKIDLYKALKGDKKHGNDKGSAQTPKLDLKDKPIEIPEVESPQEMPEFDSTDII